MRSVERAPVELSVVQNRVLVLLAGRKVLNVSDLADLLLGVNQSNASRHCANLEDYGFVNRRRSDADARVVEVSLTAAGRSVLARVDDERRRRIAEVLSRLPADTRQSAVAVFAAFNRAAGELAEVDVAPH